jgi:ABC-type uncharacterized transport system substrate-binding protein
VNPLRNACLCGACLCQDGRQAPVCRRAATGRRRQGLRNGPTLTLLLALALGIFVAPLAADAQQPAMVPRIGILTLAASLPPTFEAFRQGLRELGHVEGQNIALEYRFAQGRADRLPALAAELVRMKVDVIVIQSAQAALAAKQATQTIPIVMTVGGDPVAAGLVASLARPGGNVTGLSLQLSELSGKRLQLLKEVAPKSTLNRTRIVQFAAKSRLPAVYPDRDFATAGGLMTYGPSAVSNWRAATFVDKILKGAKPSELPVEQPTKFELVINLKTAKALGLTIPQSILLRADEVIQ